MTEFTVYGRPQPQGSTRSFWRPGMERPAITSDNPKLKSWRHDVATVALGAIGAHNMIPRPRPVGVSLRFYFARPKSAAKGRMLPVTRPDVDKAARGALDALTGIAFEDDSQVVQLVAAKLYGLPERTEIAVEALEDNRPRGRSSPSLPFAETVASRPEGG